MGIEIILTVVATIFGLLVVYLDYKIRRLQAQLDVVHERTTTALSVLAAHLEGYEIWTMPRRTQEEE